MESDLINSNTASRAGLKQKARRFFTPAPKNNSSPNKDSLKKILVRGFTGEFFGNSIVHWALIAALFLNIANWASLAVFIRPVDFPIILHYNVYFGVDLIGNWRQAYFLPAVGTIMLAVNAILAYFFYRQKERIASYLLLLAAFIVQAGISIAVASIILINY